MPDLTVSNDIDTFLTSANTSTARTSLGLGTAATTDSTDYAAASHTHVYADITDGTAGVIAGLVGETVTVTGIAVSDTTGASPDEGVLSLNADGLLTVGDGVRNTEDLPPVINSTVIQRYYKGLNGSVIRNAEWVPYLIGNIPLTAAEATSGNIVSINGTLHSTWIGSGSLPDYMFLVIVAKGATPSVEAGEGGLVYTIAKTIPSEVRFVDIKITLLASGLNWRPSMTYQTGNTCTYISDNGGTLSIGRDWEFDTDVFNLGDTFGVSGVAGGLDVYLMTSDTTNLSIPTFLISGELGAIVV